MLLKLNPAVTKLNLYDIVHTPGVAADLSHCETKSKVTGYVGEEQLKDSLKGIEIVVIPAGVPRKPGMTRDDLFNTNASIVANLCKAAAEVIIISRVLRLRRIINSGFDSLLQRAVLGHLGKGWIVRDPTTIEDCLTCF